MAKDINDIIHDKLIGSISAEDERTLREWIARNPRHQELYAQLLEDADFYEQYQRYHQIDTKRSWQTFKQKNHIGNRFLMHWRTVACAASFTLLLLGGVGYYQWTHRLVPPVISQEVTVAIKKSELQIEADTKKAEADAAYEIQKEEQRKTIEVTTANADIAKQEREIELKQKQVAVTEKSLEAEVKKKAEADKYAAQQRAEADLYQRQKDAEAKQFEAQRAAEAQKAEAEAMRYAKEQEAAGIRAVGEAEASAIQAKGIAEAEAMEKKAEAYAKYNKAAVAEMMIKVLPDIAGKVAEPLGQIDKITIIGGGEGGSNGVDQVAGNVPVVMAKVFESMKEATGIDLADIINAESYDAKVNRNVNLSGLDSVNFVVKDDGTNVTMGKPQTKVNATAVEASAQGTGTASETTNQ